MVMEMGMGIIMRDLTIVTTEFLQITVDTKQRNITTQKVIEFPTFFVILSNIANHN